MDIFLDVNEVMVGKDFYILKNYYLEFYQNKGCVKKKVFVFKGGLVLWDFRLVYDILVFVEGWFYVDRWCFVIYVCMIFVIWVLKRDFEVKRKVYEEMLFFVYWLF